MIIYLRFGAPRGLAGYSRRERCTARAVARRNLRIRTVAAAAPDRLRCAA